MSRTWSQPLESNTMGRRAIALVGSETVVRMGGFKSDHQAIADHLGHNGSRSYRQHTCITFRQTVLWNLHIWKPEPINEQAVRLEMQVAQGHEHCELRGFDNSVKVNES